MTRTLRTTLAIAGLCTAASAAALAQSRAQLMHGTYAYALSAQSGTAGSIALTAKDADHTVVVVRTNDEALVSADLRVGPCASLGGHTFAALNPPLAGASTTTVHVGIVKLTGGSFSVRVRGSTGATFACANIARANLSGVRP